MNSNNIEYSAAHKHQYIKLFGGSPLKPSIGIGCKQVVYNFTSSGVVYLCEVGLVSSTTTHDTVDCYIQNIPRIEKEMITPQIMRAEFYKEGAEYVAVRPDPYSYFDGPSLFMSIVNYQQEL